MDFTYSTHSFPYFATLNMTNVGFWKGEHATVQVLKSDENQLMMTICEPETQKLYTILLDKNIEDDAFVNSQHVNQLILQIRNLKVLSTSSLQTNCTAEEELEIDSAGKRYHVPFVSILSIVMAIVLVS